jgi:hypothetical protein
MGVKIKSGWKWVAYDKNVTRPNWGKKNKPLTKEQIQHRADVRAGFKKK